MFRRECASESLSRKFLRLTIRQADLYLGHPPFTNEDADNESFTQLAPNHTTYLVSSPYPTMLRRNKIIWGRYKEK